MFFVRAAFWIFLILLLMPTNDREKADFYTAASRTLSDLGSFCTRNPDVCDSTGAIVESLLRKVRNTVDMLEEMVTPEQSRANAVPVQRPNESQHRPQRGAGERGDRAERGDRVNRGDRAEMIAPASSRSQNTLRPEDLRPTWRGPGGV
jgi:hypothetical protein